MHGTGPRALETISIANMRGLVEFRLRKDLKGAALKNASQLLNDAMEENIKLVLSHIQDYGIDSNHKVLEVLREANIDEIRTGGNVDKPTVARTLAVITGLKMDVDNW